MGKKTKVLSKFQLQTLFGLLDIKVLIWSVLSFFPASNKMNHKSKKLEKTFENCYKNKIF